MKKLLSTAILVLLLTSFVNAQDIKIYTPTSDSGSNVSSVFTVDNGYWLKSIIFPAMKANTTSFKLLVYNYVGVYDTLYYDDVVYNPTISVHGSPVSLEANAVWGYKKFKILLPVAQDTSLTYKVIAIDPN